MEELSVQDAVRVWAEFDNQHKAKGHRGTWEDYDPSEGSILRMGCAECITNKVIRVYLEEADPMLSKAPVL